MIQTDKYKKGIIALTKRASEYNPALGEYQNHFINQNAKFVVHLSNGKLEIDIDLARECEKDPNKIKEHELKKIAFSYKTNCKTNMRIDTLWRRMFRDEKRDSPGGAILD